MKKTIIIALSLLTLLFIVACEQDPEGLAPTKTSLVGKAFYTSSPITQNQLSQGLSLDKNWNAFVWTDEIENPVPVSEALESVSDSYYYIYSYNERKYYFNPNERYAQYNNHQYYKTRLVSELKPNHQYGIYMAKSGILTYSTSSNEPTPETNIIKESTMESSLGIKTLDENEVKYFSIPINSEYNLIDINRMFTQDEVIGIDHPNQIVSLSVKANFTLNSYGSIARVILIDDNDNE